MLPASAAAALRDEFDHDFTGLGGERRATARVPPLRLVPAERAHTIERIASIFETWSLNHPVPLALDDLHWADSATLATLARLHRLVSSQRLTLMAAFRPVPHNPDLRDLISGCVGKGAERFALGPLDTDAVRGLVADTLGHQPGPALLDSAARAGGNPFLIIELVVGSMYSEMYTRSVSSPGSPRPTSARPAPAAVAGARSSAAANWRYPSGRPHVTHVVVGDPSPPRPSSSSS